MNDRRRKLFDPNRAAGPAQTPAVGRFNNAQQEIANIDTATGVPVDSSADPNPPMSVTGLISQVKNALSRSLPETLTVVGELRNVSTPASGHVYFSLTDGKSVIGAAMWKYRACKLKFRPTDGLEVVVEGKIDVYDAQGKLQLYADRMTPKGAGALELAFKQLREKLQSEGLFDPARKKPIPKFPRAIGVVTSATGAAIRDIQRTIRRRYPGAKVYLAPAMVQGNGAAEQIANQIALLDQAASQYNIDTIIVGRGGGSLEDLWAFNEEPVARAVFACNTPIISGVGHEVDISICDMVADVRAATPTAAAELAVPDAVELLRHIDNLKMRLRQNILARLDYANARLQAIENSAVFKNPAGAVRSYTQRVDELTHRLRSGLLNNLSQSKSRLANPASRLAALHPARLIERSRSQVESLQARLRWALGGKSKRAGDRLAMLESRLSGVNPKHRLAIAGQRLLSAERQLEALSYRSILARGFSVTKLADGQIVRSASQVPPGAQIKTFLHDGIVNSTVDDANSVRNASVTSTKMPAKKPAVKKAPVQKKKPAKPKKLIENNDSPTLFDL